MIYLLPFISNQKKNSDEEGRKVIGRVDWIIGREVKCYAMCSTYIWVAYTCPLY